MENFLQNSSYVSKLNIKQLINLHNWIDVKLIKSQRFKLYHLMALFDLLVKQGESDFSWDNIIVPFNKYTTYHISLHSFFQ